MPALPKKKKLRNEHKMPKDKVWKIALKHKSNHIHHSAQNPQMSHGHKVLWDPALTPHQLDPVALHHSASAPRAS